MLIIFSLPTSVTAENEEEPLKYRNARKKLVTKHIEGRDIHDQGVIRAMREVPRHRFVPPHLHASAYADRPLPIGEGQTISQPYVVALMTQILELTPKERVLEIGTGSGYQAAVLAEVTADVYTIEIKEALYERATETLAELGYTNIKTRHGDGYFGWKEAAPFDGIMITAAVDHIPPPLIAQLKDGGRLALPLGNPFSYQNLVLVTKKKNDVIVKQITGVLFVPLTGYALDRQRASINGLQ